MQWTSVPSASRLSLDYLSSRSVALDSLGAFQGVGPCVVAFTAGGDRLTAHQRVLGPEVVNTHSERPVAAHSDQKLIRNSLVCHSIRPPSPASPDCKGRIHEEESSEKTGEGLGTCTRKSHQKWKKPEKISLTIPFADRT